MERCTTHGSPIFPNDPDGLCGTGRVLIDVSRERARQFARYGTNNENENGTGPGVKWVPAIPAPHTENPGLQLEAICRHDYETTEENGGTVTWMQLVREEVAEAFAEDDPVRLREELLQVAALCVSWVETLDERAAGNTLSCEEHHPVQHRDGKPPWCRKCGLTASGSTPISKIVI